MGSGSFIHDWWNNYNFILFVNPCPRGYRRHHEQYHGGGLHIGRRGGRPQRSRDFGSKIGGGIGSIIAGASGTVAGPIGTAGGGLSGFVVGGFIGGYVGGIVGGDAGAYAKDYIRNEIYPIKTDEEKEQEQSKKHKEE